ncbi:MAG: septum formation inhibitor Maf [Desulfomonile tiedjei]|nr:septum formation inhibitor Maf [Desulfomonile tiedjei]
MAIQKTSPDVDLILASGSPRRKFLMNSVGIRFRAVPSSIDESLIAGESPQESVQRLALAKAKEVSEQFLGKWVLGADTIVVIDGRILGKPADEKEARAMLARLAGRAHLVYTGYALVNSAFPAKDRVRYAESAVNIRDLSKQQIAGYVRTGEPMDKAGAYAIQGFGSAIVERISGSYTNVVGLPLCEVARDLQELGIFDFLA